MTLKAFLCKGGVMARLASNEKMGYYPTPQKSLNYIVEFLQPTRKKVYCLDPCCGEGSALAYITQRLDRAESYGIELDPERAQTASYELRVIQGSIFDAKITPGSFGLLYLNPPYDSEEGERVEMKFLKHSIKWLAPKGVLVFIVPEHIFEKADYRAWIGQHFRGLQIYRLHRKDFPTFKQVVLFGIKRSSRVEVWEELPPPPYPYIEDVTVQPYVIPSTSGSEIFQMKEAVTEEDIIAYRSRLLAELEKIRGKFESVNYYLSPLFPLRKGHLVTLLTAGALDGKIDTPEGYLLVKGFSERIQYTIEKDDTLITTDTYNVCVRVIEMSNENFTWYDIK